MGNGQLAVKKVCFFFKTIHFHTKNSPKNYEKYIKYIKGIVAKELFYISKNQNTFI